MHHELAAALALGPPRAAHSPNTTFGHFRNSLSVTSSGSAGGDPETDK